MEKNIVRIAAELNLTPKQFQVVVGLLTEGAHGQKVDDAPGEV